MRILRAAALLGGGILWAGGRDTDTDGLPDKLEQALLERFKPDFVLSRAECDGLPSRLAAGARDPQAVARDGTIYGQASLRDGGARIELHYYHLWSRDCGRAGHALDAEHVSALLESPRADAPAKAWRARYWYAGGHEGTVCDRSTGARAEAIAAVDRGARVWISAGKHASYLDPAQCAWGCGADRCAAAWADGVEFRPGRIVNLGERRAPMNGAEWVESSKWSLRDKLRSDFPPELRAAMDRTAGVLLLWPELRPAQAFLMGGSELGAALAQSGRHTSEALRTADAATSRALETSFEKTGRALEKSARGVARFLGYRKP